MGLLRDAQPAALLAGAAGVLAQGALSMMIGLLASVASTGELWVSPSLSATVALMPSWSGLAPQPPPGWPM